MSTGLSPVKIEPAVSKKKKRRRHKVAADQPSYEERGSTVEKGTPAKEPAAQPHLGSNSVTLS